MLAKQGHDVVVLERERHPRDKVGESLIPDFWKFTDKIGATDKIKDEGFVAKAGAIISWNGEFRAHTFADFGYTASAMHVERDVFDQILFEHAGTLGAKLFENTAAAKVDVGVDDDGLEYARVMYRTGTGDEGEIEGRYVIDASGQAGVISRQLGTRIIDDSFRYLSVWGYFVDSKFLTIEGTAASIDELGEKRPVTFVTSLSDTGEDGWAWHITLRDKTSVGIVIPTTMVKDVRTPGESWESFFVRRVREVPVLKDLLADATFIPGSAASIRDYSTRSTQLSGPGFFLAGDAAGFVDPIFSVGVVLGMYTGAAAAWGVGEALRKPDKVDHTRALFNKQVEGRIEVARSLALPRYRSTGEVSEMAKEAIGLERSAVKELMYVVSSFTTRNENWLELVDGQPPDLKEGQLKQYESIEVD